MVLRNHLYKKVLHFLLVLVMAAAFLAGGRIVSAAPEGKVTIAIHVGISPSWFDPRENPGWVTPYMFQYGIHDALVKPMPEGVLTLSLAESYRESEDHLYWEFKLRQGLKFHNGDPFTAKDVKYTFETYKGSGASLYKEKVKEVEIINDYLIRFHLREPWPDFITFYGTGATGAGWIVPKDYAEKVGVDEFKNKPVGLGPYKLVEYKPGVELVLETYEGYWRKTPKVKTIIMKSVPEDATRLAMLKRGEADIAYNMAGPLKKAVEEDPNLRIEYGGGGAVFWLDFLGSQIDPKSPFSDKRVRQAVQHAIDWKAIDEAEGGRSPILGNIIPESFEFALKAEPAAYDPAKAKKLLKEAGYGKGFDAGALAPIPRYFSMGEAIVNYLAAVGIKTRMQTMERAAFITAWQEHKLKDLGIVTSGALGNASTRIEAFLYSKGTYAYTAHPRMDELFEKQLKEANYEKRKALLLEIQQLMIDEAWTVPGMAWTWPVGVSNRLKVSGVGLIPLFYYTGPFEDIELK